MPRPTTSAAWILLVITTACAGCRPSPPAATPLDYARELPPGEKALRKLPLADYPDFSVMQTDRPALVRSIDQSLTYLGHPSSERFFPYLDITHARAVATLKALRELATSPSTINWNQAIRDRFEVYQSVGAMKPDGSAYSGDVLFTGYFTPIYEASRTRTGPFQWPVYKRPIDLVSDETGEAVYRRQMPRPGEPPTPPGGPAMVPVASQTYWTRAEIERDGKLTGQELVWLKSRWEAYVITVQGSARLQMTDGRTYEIGFAGTNGHPYVSPGAQMVADGVISRDQLSLKTLGRYFADHPQDQDRYLLLNPRTTFFTERPGGPFGKLNVPVTAHATLATDKEVFPRAMPAYLVTRVSMLGPLNANLSLSQAVGGEPSERVPFRGIMLDQDAGGAIRSAGRCDIYMGIGPQAEAEAGWQLSPGQLYYLAIKP